MLGIGHRGYWILCWNVIGLWSGDCCDADIDSILIRGQDLPVDSGVCSILRFMSCIVISEFFTGV